MSPFCRRMMITELTSIEMCAGAGGQALGVEKAGFVHSALIEIDSYCCKTLRLNRPYWNIIEDDLRNFKGIDYRGEIDLLAGGLPCPPFSIAGKRLGKEDERNLFCVAIRLIDEIRPKAVMIENVRGILGAIFEDYRKYIAIQVTKMGYVTEWKLLNACDFGVPQIRPRVIFIAIRREYMGNFYWPVPNYGKPPTVGETIYGLMAANGWKGAKAWRDQANDIAPTIVGMLSSRAPSAREKTIWPGWAVPKGGWRRFPGDAGKAYVE